MEGREDVGNVINEENGGVEEEEEEEGGERIPTILLEM